MTIMRRRVIIPFILVICFIILSGCVYDSPPNRNQSDGLSQANDFPAPTLQKTNGEGSRVSDVSEKEELLVTTNRQELYNGYLESTMNPGDTGEPLASMRSETVEPMVPQPPQDSGDTPAGSFITPGESTGSPISAYTGVSNNMQPTSDPGYLDGTPGLNQPAENSGSATNPPGAYYEGAGASITPFPTRSASDCGCGL